MMRPFVPLLLSVFLVIPVVGQDVAVHRVTILVPRFTSVSNHSESVDRANAVRVTVRSNQEPGKVVIGSESASKSSRELSSLEHAGRFLFDSHRPYQPGMPVPIGVGFREIARAKNTTVVTITD